MQNLTMQSTPEITIRVTSRNMPFADRNWLLKTTKLFHPLGGEINYTKGNRYSVGILFTLLLSLKLTLMSKGILKKIAACIFAFSFYATVAQTSREQSNILDKSSFVPAGNSFFSNTISSTKLVTTSSGTLAGINLGVALSDEFSGNVEVSSPISKQGPTKPASLDGLASNGKVTLGFQFKTWKKSETKEIDPALKEFGATEFSRLKSAEKNRVLRKLDLGIPFFFGATGSINKQNFEYATDATLISFAESEKYSLIASGYGGVFIGKKINTLVRFSFVYQQVYSENSKNDYFMPFNGGPILIRQEVSIGQPVKKEQALLKLDCLTRFGEKCGINPSVTYSSGLKGAVIDLPVFFIPEERDGAIMDFNGGIFFNYTTSATHPFVAGIFIGTSLNNIL